METTNRPEKRYYCEQDNPHCVYPKCTCDTVQDKKETSPRDYDSFEVMYRWIKNNPDATSQQFSDEMMKEFQINTLPK